MRKLPVSFLAAAAIILIIALNCENTFEGNAHSYQQVRDNRVEKAIVKSILWATDEQILRLAEIIEEKYGSQIKQISRKYLTAPEDIKAIAIVESLTDENSESSAGALGLMGVKRTTAKEMGFDDIESPVNNLKAGTKYYKMLLNKFKDRELALAAYYLGPGEVGNRLNNGFDPETITYIWKIRRVSRFVI
ncbi:MAG: lytic transglycosylase domain-containing protein [Syntrophales bacterium]